ncbi:Small GTP-binding protein domain [Trinorchestia longiramus]|nr:Small GTP-binding protein domain [Trinorchestia longiramus]
MGNCLVRLGLFTEKRPVTLLLVGLDNAGKTTAAKGILGESLDTVAPTLGFVPEVLHYRGCEVTLFDLGGGAKLRPVWVRYFAEVHGVIFVIDCSATDRVPECRSVLQELLAHRRISGKPVLILANKQDLEGAMDEMDIVESLNIEETVNKHKCPTRVETCSAITINNDKPDKPIADGFRWLLDTIVVHYAELQERVQRDVEKERLRAQRQMQQIKERIRHSRAEAERQQQLKASQLLAEEEVTAAGDGDDEEEEEEEEEVVVRAGDRTALKQQVGSIPTEDAPVPEASELDSEDSPISSRGEARLVRSPSEAQELHELGLPSNSSALAALTSTAVGGGVVAQDTSQLGGSEVSLQADSDESGCVAESTASSDVAASPSLQVHRSDSGQSADNSCHRIIVVSSPCALPPHSPLVTATSMSSPSSVVATSSPSAVATASPSSAVATSSPSAVATSSPSAVATSSPSLATRISPCIQPRYLPPEGFAYSPMKEKLDLQAGDDDDGGGGCVRIDSDDELFDMDVRCTGNSVTAYVKDQLEMETSFSRAPKKKSFLRRYHKTAPASDSPSKGLSIT